MITALQVRPRSKELRTAQVSTFEVLGRSIVAWLSSLGQFLTLRVFLTSRQTHQHCRTITHLPDHTGYDSMIHFMRACFAFINHLLERY
jgi:hypothetical protein